MMNKHNIQIFLYRSYSYWIKIAMKNVYLSLYINYYINILPGTIFRNRHKESSYC